VETGSNEESHCHSQDHFCEHPEVLKLKIPAQFNGPGFSINGPIFAIYYIENFCANSGFKMENLSHDNHPSAGATIKAVVKQPFKRCPVCGQRWFSRDDFLSDPNIRLLGYQVNFDSLTLGLVLFNHDTCKDTLGVMVKDFADLQSGPVFRERKTGTEECPGYCLHECNLNRCPAKCECSWVREVVKRLSAWPKKG
jgi:hypothetical protein